jgi:hypothetical protein
VWHAHQLEPEQRPAQPLQPRLGGSLLIARQ